MSDRDSQGARTLSGKSERRKHEYRKDCTVRIFVGECRKFKGRDIVEAVEEISGYLSVLACVPRFDKFEVTLSEPRLGDDLLDGVYIKGEHFEVESCVKREMVVSFMNLPAYFPDELILTRVQTFGCTPLSEVYRHYVDDRWTDGTRYLKVRFPPHVRSIPYSVKFNTPDGIVHCTTVHNDQVKVCNHCLSPGHVRRDCKLVDCYRCGQKGHLASDCRADKCPDCGRFPAKCTCIDYDEEQSVYSDNNRERDNVEMSPAVSDTVDWSAKGPEVYPWNEGFDKMDTHLKEKETTTITEKEETQEESVDNITDTEQTSTPPEAKADETAAQPEEKLPLTEEGTVPPPEEEKMLHTEEEKLPHPEEEKMCLPEETTPIPSTSGIQWNTVKPSRFTRRTSLTQVKRGLTETDQHQDTDRKKTKNSKPDERVSDKPPQSDDMVVDNICEDSLAGEDRERDAKSKLKNRKKGKNCEKGEKTLSK